MAGIPSYVKKTNNLYNETWRSSGDGPDLALLAAVKSDGERATYYAN